MGFELGYKISKCRKRTRYPLDRLDITIVLLAYNCYAIDKNVHRNFSLMNELCKQIWGFHGSCPQFRLILVYRHYLNRFVDGIHLMR